MRKFVPIVVCSSILFAAALFTGAQQPDATSQDVSSQPERLTVVPTPRDLKPIGGRWFVKEADKPVYFHRDGERFVDLFSYHIRDSNKDGNRHVQNDDLIRRDVGFVLDEFPGHRAPRPFASESGSGVIK